MIEPALSLQEATRQLVAYWYDNREASFVGNTLTVTPSDPGFFDLLQPYRTFVF